MKVYEAHVKNGEVVLDEPVQLPEGAGLLVRLVQPGVGPQPGLRGALERKIQQMKAQHRAAEEERLRAAVRAGLEDARSGRCIDMDELLDEWAKEDLDEYGDLHGEPEWPTRQLDEWVCGNNPSTDLEYGNAFWSYVEVIRMLAHKFDAKDVRVVGTYVVRTPPPEEELPMPAIAFEVRGVQFAVRWDFGADARWPHEWTVSIDRRSPYLGPIFGLFDAELDLSGPGIPGFGPERTFGSFRADPSRFTCDVEDRLDLAMLIRLLSYEA